MEKVINKEMPKIQRIIGKVSDCVYRSTYKENGITHYAFFIRLAVDQDDVDKYNAEVESNDASSIQPKGSYLRYNGDGDVVWSDTIRISWKQFRRIIALGRANSYKAHLNTIANKSNWEQNMTNSAAWNALQDAQIAFTVTRHLAGEEYKLDDEVLQYDDNYAEVDIRGIEIPERHQVMDAVLPRLSNDQILGIMKKGIDVKTLRFGKDETDEKESVPTEDIEEKILSQLPF